MQAVLLAGLALLLAGPFTLPEPFGLGFKLTWSLISVAAAALILLAGAVKGGAPRTRLDWWLLAYVAAVALTSIGSVDRWSTLKASVTVAAEIGLFYAAASVARRMPRAVDAVLLVIVVAISLVELIALGYHAEVGFAVRPKEYPILRGWAGYPELGALAVLAFGLLLGLLLCARDRWTGWSAAGALLLLSAEIVLLYSRTAWLASAVVSGLALLVLRWPVKWKILVVAVSVAAAVVAALASPTIRFLGANLVTGTIEAPTGVRMDIASPSTRIDLWEKTIAMIADAPLNGVGLGNFRGVFETEYNPELNTDHRRGVHAHNLWLQKAAELGIPGGICYLAVWGAGLWMAGRSVRLAPKFRTTGVFLALAGTAVSEFTDNLPDMVAGLRVYLLTWVLLGLAAGTAGEGGSGGNTLRTPFPQNKDMKNTHRFRFVIASLVGLGALFAAPASRPAAQVANAAAAAPDITWIMPVWEQYSGATTQQVMDEAAKLKAAIGPEGDYVKFGFSVYVEVNMTSYTVDPTDATAVRNNMSQTIATIDGLVAKAKAAGVPINMLFLNAIRSAYDGFQTGAEADDVRNTQWFGGPGGASNPADNTISGGWMTFSRYATGYRTRYEAHIRELGKIIAEKMVANPGIFVSAAGDGEMELSFNQTAFCNNSCGKTLTDISAWLYADYSPFAIAEFRDWITASGRYASTGDFAGEAYSNAAKYPRDSAGKVQFNRDFGTRFGRNDWILVGNNYTLNDEASTKIPKSTYDTRTAEDRHPIQDAAGFDAPRVRESDPTKPGYKFWQLWLEFRRLMVQRHNRDFAKWITTSDGSHNGANVRVPTYAWYAYQIPADRITGQTPTETNYRYEASGSAWWTSDVTPYGRAGMTSFNVYYKDSPGTCWSTDPRITKENVPQTFYPGTTIPTRSSFCRTLANVGPEIADRGASASLFGPAGNAISPGLRFGLLEWHPSIGNIATIAAAAASLGLDPWGAEMDLVLQFRPTLLAPYTLLHANSDPNEQYPFYQEPLYIAALKELVRKLNLGAALNEPDPKLVVETPVTGASVTKSFTISGYSVDLGALRGTGQGPGTEKVEVFDTLNAGTEPGSAVTSVETLLGTATYGAARADVATLYGGQYTNSGFSFAASNLAPGSHTIRVQSTSTNVKTATTKSVSFTVTIPSGPTVALEAPTVANLFPPFTVSGYAFHPSGTTDSGIGTVTITATKSGVTTTLGTVTSFTDRTDVCGTGVLKACGFSLNVASLAAGTYTLTATANSPLDNSNTSKSTTITVPASSALLVLEDPANNASRPNTGFTISGYAADLRHTTAAGVSFVDFYAYPKLSGGGFGSPTFIGRVSAFTSRSDIATAYGSRFALSGFSITATLAAGDYTLKAISSSSVDSVSTEKNVDVTVTAPMSIPAVVIESPANNATTGLSFTITGSAVDRGASTGTGVSLVQVYAFPIVNGAFGAAQAIGTATYGGARPAVGALYGAQFTNSGFTIPATLAAGTYLVKAYATSTVDNALKEASATITAAPPTSNLIYSIDGPVAGQVISTQPFITGGWAIDTNAASGPGVDAFHVYTFNIVNGQPDPASAKFITSGAGGGSRPDVGAAFGSQFTNSGFTFELSGMAPGTYDLGIYFRSSVTNQFSPKFVRITVPTPPTPVHNSLMSLDGPTEGQVINRSVTPTFITGGWAIDTGATSGVGVDAIHVYAFPIDSNGNIGAGVFIEQATLGGGRSDVAAVFGSQFLNSGFNFLFNANLLTPGQYFVGVYVHSAVTGQFDANDAGQTKFVKVTIE